jgi:hypothetical protein
VCVIKFNIGTEMRNALKGKPTKVPVESLLLYAGPVYLEQTKAAKAQAGDQKHIAELESLFKLETARD